MLDHVDLLRREFGTARILRSEALCGVPKTRPVGKQVRKNGFSITFFTRSLLHYVIVTVGLFVVYYVQK